MIEETIEKEIDEAKEDLNPQTHEQFKVNTVTNWGKVVKFPTKGNWQSSSIKAFKDVDKDTLNDEIRNKTNNQNEIVNNRIPGSWEFILISGARNVNTFKIWNPN